VRVTFSTSFRDGAIEINRASEQLAAAQHTVSSGRRIATPSDDPAGTSAAITDHAVLGSLDASIQTADAAASRLTITDSTLSDIVSKIIAAQTAALSARGSVQTQNQRNAAAADLQGISDALLGDLNTRFHGVYLFGGTLAITAPYTQSGGTISAYQGNAATTSVDVGEGRLLATSVDGGSIAQGSDTTDIFTVLSNLVVAVKAGDNAGIGVGLDALERALNRATSVQTQIGTGLNALDDARARLSVARLDTSRRLSKTEDADMTVAITQMTEAETAYRAALGAFSRIANMSLMDYLR
jgi:flagellar hook-associated protein 3 FlgL